MANFIKNISTNLNDFLSKQSSQRSSFQLFTFFRNPDSLSTASSDNSSTKKQIFSTDFTPPFFLRRDHPQISTVTSSTNTTTTPTTSNITPPSPQKTPQMNAGKSCSDALPNLTGNKNVYISPCSKFPPPPLPQEEADQIIDSEIDPFIFPPPPQEILEIKYVDTSSPLLHQTATEIKPRENNILPAVSKKSSLISSLFCNASCYNKIKLSAFISAIEKPPQQTKMKYHRPQIDFLRKAPPWYHLYSESFSALKSTIIIHSMSTTSKLQQPANKLRKLRLQPTTLASVRTTIILYSVAIANRNLKFVYMSKD